MDNKEALNIIENAIYNYRPTGKTLDAFIKAKEALEKQMPKKPIIKEGLWGRDFTPMKKYFCSKCDLDIDISDVYCPHCGQKVDWSK